MSRALTTAGFELRDWQQRAVEAWVTGAGHPYRGTLEIVTGGGKTLIALECAARVAAVVPGLKLAVVVPTEALAHQWRTAIVERTSLAAPEVGLMGAGSQDSLRDHRVLVCVLNSAAKRLPEDARPERDVMLVVDECHRAGAPTFSHVLDTPSQFRLGLSATPDRDDIDEDGEPLAYDEQVVGRALGDVVYRFSLRDARTILTTPPTSRSLTTSMHKVRALLDIHGGHIPSTGVYRIRVLNPEVLEPAYLAEVLAGSWNDRLQTGSTIKRAPIKDLEIPLMSLEHQRIVAEGLTAIRILQQTAADLSDESAKLRSALQDAVRYGARVPGQRAAQGGKNG